MSANNMLTDIKLSKAQISKIIQSRGSLRRTLVIMMDKLGKKVLLDLALPLAKDVLPKLATKATSTVLEKFEKPKSGKRAGKEDVDDNGW